MSDEENGTQPEQTIEEPKKSPARKATRKRATKKAAAAKKSASTRKPAGKSLVIV